MSTARWRSSRRTSTRSQAARAASLSREAERERKIAAEHQELAEEHADRATEHIERTTEIDDRRERAGRSANMHDQRAEERAERL